MDIDSYRSQNDKQFTSYIMQIKRKSDYVKKSIRTSFGDVDCFFYYPENGYSLNNPVCFNFHGGGFVLGYPEQDNDYCRFIANQANILVINVNYFLAPEHRFPIAIESSSELINGVLEHSGDYDINPECFFLSGSSAGGNLIFAIDQLLQKRYKKISNGIISNYPITDMRGYYKTSDYNKNRYSQYITTYLLEPELVNNPLASPQLSHPRQHQKILLNLAEKDPLLKQEELFYKTFLSQGADIKKQIYLGAQHGFLHPMYAEYNQEQAEHALTEIIRFIKLS